MIKVGTLYATNQEEKYYSDILKQLEKGEELIYVYNKNIIERLQKQFPNLNIKERDFYWVIRNKVK